MNKQRAKQFYSFWAIVVLSLFLSHAPGCYWFFTPLNIFTTAVHELGHATVCLLTGGYIEGLTIVSDGAGHGGLTFCRGGNPFLYAQAGYLGAALFGCFLIILSQYPRLSKAVLVIIGIAIGATSLILMPATLLRSGMLIQGMASILWAAVMSAVLVFCGIKLKANRAHILLLFLAVQTALNSVTGIGDLLSASLGMFKAGSDASSMAVMTGIPAIIWSLLWGACSIIMLFFTLKETYGKRLFSNK